MDGALNNPERVYYMKYARVQIRQASGSTIRRMGDTYARVIAWATIHLQMPSTGSEWYVVGLANEDIQGPLDVRKLIELTSLSSYEESA